MNESLVPYKLNWLQHEWGKNQKGTWGINEPFYFEMCLIGVWPVIWCSAWHKFLSSINAAISIHTGLRSGAPSIGILRMYCPSGGHTHLYTCLYSHILYMYCNRQPDLSVLPPQDAWRLPLIALALPGHECFCSGPTVEDWPACEPRQVQTDLFRPHLFPLPLTSLPFLISYVSCLSELSHFLYLFYYNAASLLVLLQTANCFIAALCLVCSN